MGVFRFQRHVGILPGLRFNLSKSGVSLSVEVKGAHVTVGRTRASAVGIPGSGLSSGPRRCCAVDALPKAHGKPLNPAALGR